MLNISIEKGARIEIKGVQALDMLPDYVTLEVERQLALLEIKNSLEKKKLSPEIYIAEYKDCKEVFTKTTSKLLKKAMKDMWGNGLLA